MEKSQDCNTNSLEQSIESGPVIPQPSDCSNEPTYLTQFIAENCLEHFEISQYDRKKFIVKKKEDFFNIAEKILAALNFVNSMSEDEYGQWVECKRFENIVDLDDSFPSELKIPGNNRDSIDEVNYSDLGSLALSNLEITKVEIIEENEKKEEKSLETYPQDFKKKTESMVIEKMPQKNIRKKKNRKTRTKQEKKLREQELKEHQALENEMNDHHLKSSNWIEIGLDSNLYEFIRNEFASYNSNVGKVGKRYDEEAKLLEKGLKTNFCRDSLQNENYIGELPSGVGKKIITYEDKSTCIYIGEIEDRKFHGYGIKKQINEKKNILEWQCGYFEQDNFKEGVSFQYIENLNRSLFRVGNFENNEQSQEGVYLAFEGKIVEAENETLKLVWVPDTRIPTPIYFIHGMFTENQVSGNCREFCNSSKCLTIANYYNNNVSGKTVQKYSDDRGYYIGNYKNNMKDGNGKLVLKDQEQISAHIPNKQDVRTSIVKIKKLTYNGEFFRNKFHGFANEELIYEDGHRETYEGNMQENKYNGKGFKIGNNYKYGGYFEDNNFQGAGQLHLWFGSYLSSQTWRRSFPTGISTFVAIVSDGIKEQILEFHKKNTVNFHSINPDFMQQLNSKERFHGKLISGVKHGFGVQIHGNGEIFIGHFEFNLKHGSGEFHYLDGSIFIGKWFKGKKSGSGSLRRLDKKEFKQEWYDDKLISKDGSEQLLSLVEENRMDETEFSAKCSKIWQNYTDKKIKELSNPASLSTELIIRKMVEEKLKNVPNNYPFMMAIQQAYNEEKDYEFFTTVYPQIEVNK